MILQNIAGLLVGIITKLYDDLTDSVDLQISEKNFIIELLKVLQVSIVTIWFYNDHFNAILATSALIVAYFAELLSCVRLITLLLPETLISP
mgnify:CR=1 FL=1